MKLYIYHVVYTFNPYVRVLFDVWGPNQGRGSLLRENSVVPHLVEVTIRFTVSFYLCSCVLFSFYILLFQWCHCMCCPSMIRVDVS